MTEIHDALMKKIRPEFYLECEYECRYDPSGSGKEIECESGRGEAQCSYSLVGSTQEGVIKDAIKQGWAVNHNGKIKIMCIKHSKNKEIL